jgi:hypothetical protein
MQGEIQALSTWPCIPQEDNMRDIQEVLSEKQRAMERLRSEVEALRSLTPLLSEAGVFIAKPTIVERENETYATGLGNALQTAGPLLVEEDGFDPEIRARLADATENARKLSIANRFSRGLRKIAAPLFDRS